MNTPPRRLERSRSDRMVAGVCGGVAAYLNMDAALVRLLTVVLTLVTGGAPVLLYLVAMIVMPEEGRTAPGQRPSVAPGAPGTAPYAATDFAPRQRAAEPDPVWGPDGAPWEQPASRPAPPPSSAPPPWVPGAPQGPYPGERP